LVTLTANVPGEAGELLNTAVICEPAALTVVLTGWAGEPPPTPLRLTTSLDVKLAPRIVNVNVPDGLLRSSPGGVTSLI
jgi:hypothetical protein